MSDFGALIIGAGIAIGLSVHGFFVWSAVESLPKLLMPCRSQEKVADEAAGGRDE